MKRISYYKLLDILQQHNMGTGLIFSIAQGKVLDRYGEIRYGMKRKRWWIFRESDTSFKARILYREMVEQGYIEGDE